MTRQWTLPEGPGAIAAARREVEAVLVGRADQDDAVLVASELCTNALLHGRPPIALRVSDDGDVLRIEVENRREGPPVDLSTRSGMPGPKAIGGRGLALVQAIADDWGWRDGDGSTCVWAELRAEG